MACPRCLWKCCTQWRSAVTKHLVAKKWISTKAQFTRFDEFKEGVEYNEPFTGPAGGQYVYQKEGSYGNLGGYVANLDVLAKTEDEVRA